MILKLFCTFLFSPSAPRHPLVLNHASIDPSNPWESKICSTATKRLESGPSNPDLYTFSNKFTDLSFNGTDQLFWDGFSTGASSSWMWSLTRDYYQFRRIPEGNPLFDAQGAHFNDVE